MKKTLRNIVLAGSVALAGGLGVLTYSGNGCIRNIDYENSNTTSAPDSLVYSQNSLEGKTENEKDFVPSLEEFKMALGDRYMPEREKELKEFWEKLEGEEEIVGKNLLFNIYKRPTIDSFIGTFKGMPLERIDWTLNLYKDFDPDSIPREKYNEYLSRFPWRIVKTDSNFNEADKLMLFYNRWFDECMSEVAAEWFAKQLIDYAIMPMLEAEREKNRK